MPTTRTKSMPKHYSATELRRMPVVERDAILRAAAAHAAKEYTSNKNLIDFEAFGEEDLYGSSSDSETSSR
jgi:hypothetical protein